VTQNRHLEIKVKLGKQEETFKRLQVNYESYII